MAINLISKLLKNFGLNSKESEIFIFLYKIWPSVASTIANAIWEERTNTYKTLQKLTSEWIISEITKKSVKHFYISDKNIFSNKLDNETREIELKKKSIITLNTELEKISPEKSYIPSIRFFEWKLSMKDFFRDILNMVEKEKLLEIKMFASNTFEEKASSHNIFSDYAAWFLEELNSKNIWVETYLWNWVLMLESLSQTYQLDNLKELPAGSSSVQIFVFWKFIYIAIFKEIPFWIKVESRELASIMSFLFKEAYS